MSRRCRASLLHGGAGVGSLDSGCECARLGGGRLIDPCTNDINLGFMTLDGHVTLHGLGPNGDEVPASLVSASGGTRNVDKPFFSDGSKIEYPAYVKSLSSNGVIIDTADPPPGSTYHFFFPAGTAGSPAITLGSGYICSRHFPGPEAGQSGVPSGVNRPYVSKVNPGDLATVTCVFKVDTTSGNPQVEVLFSMFDSAGAFFGESAFSELVTTTYETYTFGFFIPQGITEMLFVRVSSFATNTASNRSFGNIAFGLFQGTQGILLCAQSNLITIDNSTVEEAFL